MLLQDVCMFIQLSWLPHTYLNYYLNRKFVVASRSQPVTPTRTSFVARRIVYDFRNVKCKSNLHFIQDSFMASPFIDANKTLSW